MKDLFKDIFSENFSGAECIFYGIIVPLILVVICIAVESYPNFIK